MKPEEIEKKSFEIIEEEAGVHGFAPDEWSIVRRVIHTSADFEYLKSIRIHPEAVKRGVGAIQKGETIITDTNMAKSGIRKADLAKFGGKAECFITHPDVARAAKEQGITRAKAALRFASEIIPKGIYVVGNAPTALLELIELVEKGDVAPALIIGFPVGFVNAAESKEELINRGYPSISNVGRKGGSNVAASVVNALIILAGERSK